MPPITFPEGEDGVLVAETPSAEIYAVRANGTIVFEVFRKRPEAHRCRSYLEALACAATGIRQVWLAPGDVALVGRAWVGAGDVCELACVETSDLLFNGRPSCRPGTLIHADFDSLEEGFEQFAALVDTARVHEDEFVGEDDLVLDVGNLVPVPSAWSDSPEAGTDGLRPDVGRPGGPKFAA